MKQIIINADDFGYSKVFNETILNLIEANLIKSTTVMVNWIIKEQKNQIEKIKELNKIKNLSLGLHLEFNSENYKEEIKEQYKKFIEIFQTKPSHLDIHKSLQKDEKVKAVNKFAIKNNLPARSYGIETPNLKATKSKYANGTNMNQEEISNWIQNLDENEIIEILFHPGTYDPNCKSSLNKQREKEIEKIKFLNTILEKNNAKLISFKELE